MKKRRPIPPITPVTSSAMAGYHYDPATKTLTVQFQGGGHYLYAGVPQSKIDEMVTAKSIGGYFAANLRSHKSERL